MEEFESLFTTRDVLIERIISTGQITPEGEWYDQERDEWVVLLEGKAVLGFENNERLDMVKGDYLLIPAHCKHRVLYTQTDPPCIWLAVHVKLYN